MVKKAMERGWAKGTYSKKKGFCLQSSQTQDSNFYHYVFQKAILQAGHCRMRVGWAGWWCHWQSWQWQATSCTWNHMLLQACAQRMAIAHKAAPLCNSRNRGRWRRTSRRLTLTSASKRERPNKGVCVKSPRQSSHAVRHWKPSRCHPLGKSEVM